MRTTYSNRSFLCTIFAYYWGKLFCLEVIFSASDVIPHIRNWIPTLPQRVFPCGSELISMRVRALFLAGQSSFHADQSSFHAAQKPKCQHSSSLMFSIKMGNLENFERDPLAQLGFEPEVLSSTTQDLSHHRSALILLSYREMVDIEGFISPNVDLVCNFFDCKLPGWSNLIFYSFI